jgi:hypothetical protein
MAELAKLIGDADLAVGRSFQRELDNDPLAFRRRAVLQNRFAPRQLLQRQFAAGVVEFLEAVEAVAAVAHHFAGLADVAKLLGQLQKPHLGADDFLFLGQVSVLSKRRGRSLRNPDHVWTAPWQALCDATALWRLLSYVRPVDAKPQLAGHDDIRLPGFSLLRALEALVGIRNGRSVVRREFITSLRTGQRHRRSPADLIRLSAAMHLRSELSNGRVHPLS